MTNFQGFDFQSEYPGESHRRQQQQQQQRDCNVNILDPGIDKISPDDAFELMGIPLQNPVEMSSDTYGTTMENEYENRDVPISRISSHSQTTGGGDNKASSLMKQKATLSQTIPDISLEIMDDDRLTINGNNDRLVPNLLSSQTTPHYGSELSDTDIEMYSDIAYMNLRGGDSLLSSPNMFAASPMSGFNDTVNTSNDTPGEIDRLSVYSNSSSFYSNGSNSSTMLPLDPDGYKHVSNLDDLDLLLSNINPISTSFDTNFNLNLDQPNFLDVSSQIDRTMSAVPVISIQDFNGPEKTQRTQHSALPSEYEKGNRGRSLSQPIVKVEEVDKLDNVDRKFPTTNPRDPSFKDNNSSGNDCNVNINNNGDTSGLGEFNLSFPLDKPKLGQFDTTSIQSKPTTVLNMAVQSTEENTGDCFGVQVGKNIQSKGVFLSTGPDSEFLQLPCSFDERMIYGIDDGGATTSDANSIVSDVTAVSADEGEDSVERYELIQGRKERSRSRIGRKSVSISVRSGVEHAVRSPSPHLEIRRRGYSVGNQHFAPSSTPFDEKARSITGNRDKLLEMADLLVHHDNITRSLRSDGIGISGNESSHRTTRSYVCKICGKCFSRPYNLKSHLRTHTNERPYSCSICGKSFARQHDRKRHEDLHSGKKRYVCGGTLKNGQKWGCGKKFARSDALGRHFKTECGRRCIAPLYEEAAMESAERP